MIESRQERSPWWMLLLLAFFVIMATGMDSDAGDRKIKPGKAAFSLIFYGDPPEGARDLFVRLLTRNDNGLLVEKCTVNGRTTYRPAKRVDPVKLETETKNEGGE